MPDLILPLPARVEFKFTIHDRWFHGLFYCSRSDIVVDCKCRLISSEGTGSSRRLRQVSCQRFDFEEVGLFLIVAYRKSA